MVDARLGAARRATEVVAAVGVKYRFFSAAKELLVVGTQGIGTHFSSSLNCRPRERHREQFVIVVAEFAWNGFLHHLE